MYLSIMKKKYLCRVTWVFRFYPLPPHFPPTCPTCQLSRAALKFPFQDYTLNYTQQIPKSQAPSTNLKTATSKFSIWYLHIDIWIMVNIFEDSRITIGLNKLRMIYSLLRPPSFDPRPPLPLPTVPCFGKCHFYPLLMNNNRVSAQCHVLYSF